VQFLDLGREDRRVRRHDEVAQVEVLVGGLVLARGDVVDVDVQGPRRRRVEGEGAEPGLFHGLPECDLFAGRLARIGMASRLEPSVELAVVKQEHPVSRGRDDDGAPRQVALGNPTIEGVGVAAEEVDDPVAVSPLLLVGTGMHLKRARKSGDWILGPVIHDPGS
jgi:hypothetical protein